MIELKSNRLYILAGPQCTGKSTFLSQLNVPDDNILSMDALRIQILGTRQYVAEDDAVCSHISESANNAVYNILLLMLRSRMSQRLTTFIDAMSCKESDRNAYARIAAEYGVETTVLIMPTPIEVALKRNETREFRIPVKLIEKNYSNMIYEGALDQIVIDSITYSIVNVRPRRVDILTLILEKQ